MPPAFQIAAAVQVQVFSWGGVPTIRWWQRSWWRWDGKAYRLVPSHIMKMLVRTAIMQVFGDMFNTLSMVTKVMEEAKYLPQVALPDHWQPPFWIPADQILFSEQSEPDPADQLVSVANGVLDIQGWLDASRSSSLSQTMIVAADHGGGLLLPHTPELFVTTATTLSVSAAGESSALLGVSSRFCGSRCFADGPHS